MLTPTLYLISVITFILGTEDFRSNLNLTGLDYDAWWGSSEHSQADTTIRRIKLIFSDEMIQDLKYRLKHRRPITPSLEGTWFEYGINSNVTEDWLNYWENEYPFKHREQVMNQFPHYMTNIQGLDIHFIRARPKVSKDVKVVPLLLTNGWPSSFAAFYEVIPRLIARSKDRDFAVEVIYPTIPGFTLSEGAVRPGLGPPEIGVLVRKLMHRLGHKKYYMACGDFGFFICNFIATAFPEDVQGFFTQMVLLQSIAARIPFYSSALIPSLANSIYVGNNTKGRRQEDDIRQLSYLYHQSMSPDTIAIGLNDSPSGLLSYLLEQFYFGRVLERKENAGMNIQDHIPRDALLDNVMLYWMTGSIGTSMRIYAETLNRRVWAMNIDETPSPVPTWITEPKYADYISIIRELNEVDWHSELCSDDVNVQTKYPNLISYKTLEFGGHFFPFEFPEFYAKEVLTAITAFRKND